MSDSQPSSISSDSTSLDTTTTTTTTTTSTSITGPKRRKGISTETQAPDIVIRPDDGAALEPEGRAMYVDWLRSVAIYLVVFGHVLVAMKQADVGRNEIPPRVNAKIDGTLRYFVQFMMPLFMYLSGRALAFSEKPALALIYSKFIRLIVPMVIGCALWVIPGQYLAREYRACANPDEDRFWPYWIYYWRDDFPCNGFDYLWFLAVLFVLQMFNLPLFLFLRDRYNVRTGLYRHPQPSITSNVTKLSIQAVLVTIILPALFFVTSDDRHTTTAGITGYWLFAVSGYIGLVLTAVYLPWLQRRLRVFGFYLMFLSFVLPGCFMALIIDDYIDFTQDVIPTIVSHNFFFLGGLYTQMYRVEYKYMKKDKSRRQMMPIGLLFLILMLGLCSPSDPEDVGYLWRIPLYNNWPNRTLFMIGAWIWMALLTRWGQAFYFERLSPFQYKHLGASSIIVYIVHYFPIIFVQVYIARPVHMWWFYNMLITIVITITFCWGLYFLCLVTPGLAKVMGVPLTRNPKGRDRVEKDGEGQDSATDTSTSSGTGSGAGSSLSAIPELRSSTSSGP